MITIGAPLSREQWNNYKDKEGRILNPQEVKEVIFRGVCTYNLHLNFLSHKWVFYERASIKFHTDRYKKITSTIYKPSKE